jgi:hypothetical protein
MSKVEFVVKSEPRNFVVQKVMIPSGRFSHSRPFALFADPKIIYHQ